jgi:hypothetical protein
VDDLGSTGEVVALRSVDFSIGAHTQDLVPEETNVSGAGTSRKISLFSHDDATGLWVATSREQKWMGKSLGISRFINTQYYTCTYPTYPPCTGFWNDVFFFQIYNSHNIHN